MLMDIRLTEIAQGRAVFTGTPQEFHYNPLGSVHGGYGATLLDSAMGCAVHSTLDAGDIYTTLEFKINFLRALTHETGLVRGIGTVINETRTTALAEGRIEDAARQALRLRDDDLRDTKGRNRVSGSGTDDLLACWPVWPTSSRSAAACAARLRRRRCCPCASTATPSAASVPPGPLRAVGHLRHDLAVDHRRRSARRATDRE